MTKKKIARQVRFRFDLKKSTAEKIVKEVLDCIILGLEQDGRVELRGFGTFETFRRPPRVFRDPRTGKPLPKVETCRVRFRASKNLHRLVDAVMQKEERSPVSFEGPFESAPLSRF